MISFFRVSGVPQKGKARTPLTRKKEITKTQSSHKTRSLTGSLALPLTLTLALALPLTGYHGASRR